MSKATIVSHIVALYLGLQIGFVLGCIWVHHLASKQGKRADSVLLPDWEARSRESFDQEFYASDRDEFGL